MTIILDERKLQLQFLEYIDQLQSMETLQGYQSIDSLIHCKGILIALQNNMLSQCHRSL